LIKEVLCALNLSPNQHSGTPEGDSTIKNPQQQNYSKQSFKVLQLNLTQGELEREDDSGNLIKTQRTIDSRIEEGSFHRLGAKEELSSLKNLSPINKKPRPFPGRTQRST
jgi:hypothetical protein